MGLVDRADAAGLVIRERDADDHRIVRLRLTAEAAERLEKLSALHVQELERLSGAFPGAWAGLDPVHEPHGAPSRPDPGSYPQR